MQGATNQAGFLLRHCFVSIHAPHAGHDPAWVEAVTRATGFNPRAPCGARPSRTHIGTRRTVVSIHAPHAGRDRRRPRARVVLRRFQSTRPVRGATLSCAQAGRRRDVSIHAPRAGRDHLHERIVILLDVSIHAPRAGRDIEHHNNRYDNPKFQSTRPVRGATPMTKSFWIPSMFQSTRPVRGATPIEGIEAITPPVSIHAPRAGRDRWRLSFL